MDHKKTGDLIAKKRKELELTQKELADRLNISDRTVSKWERGFGFPDISLIEPVADELGISVLELIHGKEDEFTEMEERSARKTLDTIEPEVKGKIKRFRVIMMAMLVIIIVMIIGFAYYVSNVSGGKWVGMKEVTLVEAVNVMQDIVINSNDKELLEEVKKDDAVKKFIENGNDELLIADIDQDHYSKKVAIPDEKIEFFIVQADKGFTFITYGSNYINYNLFEEADGSIVKNITKYSDPYRTEDGLLPDEDRKVVYHIENTNNDVFRMSVIEKNMNFN